MDGEGGAEVVVVARVMVLRMVVVRMVAVRVVVVRMVHHLGVEEGVKRVGIMHELL